MTEDDLKKLQFESFSALLNELVKQGYGEISYKVVVKNGKIEYISLTKTTTHKPLNDIISSI